MIILTDSTADIRGDELNKLNIKMVSLNVDIDGEVYQDSKNLMPDKFYELIAKSKEFPKTSCPSPNDFAEIFECAKNDNEELIYLGVSSGLSGTVNSARLALDIVEYDKIYIVDTLESIQGLRLLVLEACKMRDAGLSAKEIVDKIEYLKHHVQIYSMIDTLEYLYRGGRLKRTVAIIGNVLKLKPLIDLDGEGKIRMYGTCLGIKRAYLSIMKSIENAPIDINYPVCFGYTYGKENLDLLIEKVKAKYPNINYNISQIGPAIGSHIGPGGFCVMYVSDKERNK